MTGKRPPRWQADLALASVALIWGVTFVLIKQALTEISTVYFLVLRFGLATVCMSGMFARAFWCGDRKRSLAGLRGGAITGVFLWLGYMLQTFGLKYTTAGKSGFLTGLYVVLVPLIAAGIYRRWPAHREWLGVGFAAAGMVVLTMPSVNGAWNFNRGDLMTIGCAVAFAFQILLLGHYSQREMVQGVALGQIGTVAVLSLLSLPTEPPVAVWSGNVIRALLVTAVLATALAFAVQTWGQKYTTTTRAALIFSLEPVFALVTAAAVGGEALTLSAILGGLLILAGILVVELKPARSA
jgi:drug/metabolite transporter (DMT)-like permease